MNSVPGFIVKKVYPYFKGVACVEAETFLNKQPSNVVSLLRWESQHYTKGNIEKDPSPREFIYTSHPNIYYSTPKRWKRGKDKIPQFFCCSHCNGRAFWGTPICGWCGKNILGNIKDDLNSNAFFSLVDYLYPPSSKPPIAKILSEIVEDTKIDPHELELEMKTIKEHVPTAAHAKNIDFGMYNGEWCLVIEGTPVSLNDIGVSNKNGFANLYFLKGSVPDYKKYFLSEALARAYSSTEEIGIKKMPLKELTIDKKQKVITLVPKNKKLNLGVTVL